MSILKILRRIKFQKFQDDFIRSVEEDAMNDASLSVGAKIIDSLQHDPEKLSARDSLQEWMDDEWERHSNPSDPASITYIAPWEE